MFSCLNLCTALSDSSSDLRNHKTKLVKRTKNLSISLGVLRERDVIRFFSNVFVCKNQVTASELT